MSFFHPSFIPSSYWKWVRWPLWFLEALLIYELSLIFVLIFSGLQQDYLKPYVQEIQLRHIKLDDVLGTNLPPTPDPKKANRTLRGIDANHNGIRDDVELAIFKNHPDDKILRAAQLQYAFDLQMYFTDVRDKQTLDAVSWQEDRGYGCVNDTVPLPWKSIEEMTQELATPRNIKVSKRQKEVEDLVQNTPARKAYIEKIYGRFYDGGGSLERSVNDCDLAQSILQ